MQQISRPYQIALVVLVLAAATWFVAFGHRSSSSGGSSASSSAPAASQPTSGSGGSAPGQVYHGSAPGVEGLTKAIAKAHGAVTTSESYAHHVEEKSAQATSTTPAESGSSSAAPGSAGSSSAPAKTTTHAGTTHVTATTKHAGTTAHVKATTKHAGTTTHVTATTRHAGTTTHVKATVKHAAPATPAPRRAPTTSGVTAVGVPVGQREVEAAVQHGKVAVLLFWNAAGSNDRAVRDHVRSVRGSRLGVDVFESSARNVASYGAITRQMPVYGTPTILIIGPHRSDSLTGLQDTFSIEQAIKEVRTG